MIATSVNVRHALEELPPSNPARKAVRWAAAPRRRQRAARAHRYDEVGRSRVAGAVPAAPTPELTPKRDREPSMGVVGRAAASARTLSRLRSSTRCAASCHRCQRQNGHRRRGGGRAAEAAQGGTQGCAQGYSVAVRVGGSARAPAAGIAPSEETPKQTHGMERMPWRPRRGHAYGGGRTWSAGGGAQAPGRAGGRIPGHGVRSWDLGTECPRCARGGVARAAGCRSHPSLKGWRTRGGVERRIGYRGAPPPGHASEGANQIHLRWKALPPSRRMRDRVRPDPPLHPSAPSPTPRTPHTAARRRAAVPVCSARRSVARTVLIDTAASAAARASR